MDFETKRPSKLSLRVLRGALSSLTALARSKVPGQSVAYPTQTGTLGRRKRLYTFVGLGVGAGLAVAWAVQASEKTEELPKLEPRMLHGAPRLKEADDGYVRWREYATKVFVDGSVHRMHPAASDAVQSAFGAWVGSGAILPELEVDSSPSNRFGARRDGKNTVVVAPITIQGHEDDLAVTISYWDDSSGDIGEADIVINEKVVFDVVAMKDGEAECEGGLYDLQNVMTHEAGHFFGLGEDFDDREATMYSSSRMCETRKRELEGSDEKAIVDLYIDGLGPTETGLVCSVRGPGTGGSGAGAVLAGLALIRWLPRILRRRPRRDESSGPPQAVPSRPPQTMTCSASRTAAD